MNVPEIRFKEFCDYYSDVLLEKCLSVSNKKNNKLEYKKEDALSVSDEFGVVNQIEHLGRSYTGNNISTYKILNKWQIVYTKSPLKLKPFGIIKVNNNKPGIVSVLYAIYDVKEGFDPNYISVYFEPNFRLNKYLLPLINKGAKNTINISDETALSGEVHIPLSYTEQQKIASYFQSLDSLIQTISKKLASLKQIKAASLQSMFPQEGETVPKVRFKGFEGKWEKEKLCNIASRITRKNKNLESFTPLTISAIEGLVSQLTYFNNIVASSNISGYYLIKNGEFAYNKSYSNGFPYGSIKRLDKFDMGVLSTLYIVFALNKQNTSILSDYLVIFFNTTLWHHEIAKRAEEGARNHGLLNISAEDFLDINIIYPKDLLEQQKIASYFCNLDKQISLQTQRLEKLKQIKVACLDKMFV